MYIKLYFKQFDSENTFKLYQAETIEAVKIPSVTITPQILALLNESSSREDKLKKIIDEGKKEMKRREQSWFLWFRHMFYDKDETQKYFEKFKDDETIQQNFNKPK